MPKSLRQEYTEHTRQALIEAATRLFTERGYANTSIDEVASAARVTRGALYHHFSSKQDIFAAVCDSVDAEIIHQIQKAAAKGGTAEERMRRILDVYLESSRNPAYRAVVLGEAYKAQSRQEGQRYTPGMSTVVSGLIKQLVQKGDIEVEDPHLLSKLLCAALYEVALAVDSPHYTQQSEEYAKKIICAMLFRAGG
jgi:AcrR family transcriptional regulator